MRATLEIPSHFPGFILRADDGRTALVQTDWDYPGLASDLGIWSTKHRARGYHEEDWCAGARSTDGTVPCPVCKRPAGWFIQGAEEVLYEHEGEPFDVPDEYFPVD